MQDTNNIIRFPTERTRPAIKREMKKEFSAIDFVKRRFQGDADINEILVMLWPHTTEGKKESLRFNPDF